MVWRAVYAPFERPPQEKHCEPQSNLIGAAFRLSRSSQASYTKSKCCLPDLISRNVYSNTSRFCVTPRNRIVATESLARQCVRPWNSRRRRMHRVSGFIDLSSVNDSAEILAYCLVRNLGATIENCPMQDDPETIPGGVGVQKRPLRSLRFRIFFRITLYWKRYFISGSSDDWNMLVGRTEGRATRKGTMWSFLFFVALSLAYKYARLRKRSSRKSPGK